LSFNAAISNLGVEELKLYRNKFTWINKQESPMLKRLDWFFASSFWITNYSGSSVQTLSRDISDHNLCLITISTDIPKAMIFRFENYSLLHEDFMQVMDFGWGIPNNEQDKAKRVGAKFKALRKVRRQWHSQISNLTKTIENSKTIISFPDILEESRDLSLEEWNFRNLLQDHLAKLLKQQRVYWKQRGRIKWATLGDENTKFFHGHSKS
jgi:hypothetical protein